LLISALSKNRVSDFRQSVHVAVILANTGVERVVTVSSDDGVVLTQIYYASEEFGVHDTRTSGGYFHMAEVFQQQGNVTVAQSLYQQVLSDSLTHSTSRSHSQTHSTSRSHISDSLYQQVSLSHSLTHYYQQVSHLRLYDLLYQQVSVSHSLTI